MVHSQPQPQPQVVHSASRSNSMPSWRGYLPMKFEPMAMDQYQITAHYSQKVFLGGIPPELTEGSSFFTHFFSLHYSPLPSFFS
jgi:hypothetical protein